MAEFNFCPEARQVAKERKIDLTKFSNKPLRDFGGSEGKSLVTQAKEEAAKRKRSANSELAQVSKDIASYMCNGMTGRAVFVPQNINPASRPKETGKWELIKGKLVKVK